MITFPNAKINIGLNITEKRQDGYHNLETIFYPIELQDALEFVRAEKFEFNTSGLAIEGKEESNLIVKAYKMLKEEFDIPRIKIHLHKTIPMGAGLGGGSADAAFMLKMLNKEFKLGLSSLELEKRAARLGADCPFFIENKPTFASGIGDQFRPISLDLRGKKIVLIKPDIHISTAEAYANCKPGKWETPLIEAIKEPIKNWKEKVANDFEKSVFIAHPQLRDIKEMLYGLDADYAAMSGSGSTIYGIFGEANDLDEIRAKTAAILKNKESECYELDLK